MWRRAWSTTASRPRPSSSTRRWANAWCPRTASAATRRPGLPVATTTGAWHQTLLAAAWPGPTQLTVRSALAGRDDSLVPLAAELGSWLLARGLDRRAPAAARRAPLVDLTLGRTPTDGPVEPTPRRVRTRAPRVPAAVPLLPLDALGLALLDATGDAVLADGFARTTVGGIARRAGTSTGAVYNRFSGKGGLLAEAHRHGLPGTVAGRETAMALRVEALRVAPDDPEVSAAVAATTGRSVTLLAHDLAEAQRERTHRCRARCACRRLGDGLARGRDLGAGPRRRIGPPRQRLDPRVRMRHTSPRQPGGTGVASPSTRRHQGATVADEDLGAARRLRTGGAGAPRRGLAARVGRRGHRAHRGRQPAAQRRHPRALRQGPRRGRRTVAGRSVPGRALRPQGPRTAQCR